MRVIKDSILNCMFYIAIVVTILSQSPSFVESSGIRSLMYLIWIAIIIFKLLFYRVYINRKVIWVYIFALPFFIYMQILISMGNRLDFTKRDMLLSLFMLFVGVISSEIEEKVLQKYLYTYIYSILFISIDTYVKYFSGFSFNGANNYIYSQKNSLGYLILMSLIILIIFNKNLNIILKIIRYGLIIFFSVFLLLVQSRSSVIVLVIAMLIYLIVYIRKRKVAIYMLFISPIVVMLLINDKVSTLLNYGLMLDRLSNQGVSGWSSGRMGMFNIAMESINKNLLLGTSDQIINYGWIENFYVQLTYSFGIAGLFLITIFLLVLLWSIFTSKSVKMKTDTGKLAVMCITCMLIVAFFEQSAPFGPGAIHFMEWIVIGCVLNKC